MDPPAEVQPVIQKPSIVREASGKPANITLQPLTANQGRLQHTASGSIKYRNRNDLGGKIVRCTDGELSGSAVHGTKRG